MVSKEITHYKGIEIEHGLDTEELLELKRFQLYKVVVDSLEKVYPELLRTQLKEWDDDDYHYMTLKITMFRTDED